MSTTTRPRLRRWALRTAALAAATLLAAPLGVGAARAETATPAPAQPVPTATAPALSTGEKAIAAKYASAQGILGTPTGDVVCGLAGDGCFQDFQQGSIHWSPASGAHWSRGEIRNKWSATGTEGGTLGYPTTDEICGLARSGCVQIFQKGSIHWSPASGAHWTSGSVQSLWGQRGYENGSYGYPIGDPLSVAGKTSQRFQGGYLTSGVDSRCLTGRTMCASKTDRKVQWMIDGQVVKTLDARFGCSSSPSDNGQFKVYWKSYNHTSTLYNTWMPRAMFYNGGEAVHYSSDFAARGYAGCSHGCVNIRDWNGINWLYSQVQNGDKVVVY